MEKYESLEMELIIFKSDDVIMTSVNDTYTPEAEEETTSS